MKHSKDNELKCCFSDNRYSCHSNVFYVYFKCLFISCEKGTIFVMKKCKT